MYKILSGLAVVMFLVSCASPQRLYDLRFAENGDQKIKHENSLKRYIQSKNLKRNTVDGHAIAFESLNELGKNHRLSGMSPKERQAFYQSEVRFHPQLHVEESEYLNSLLIYYISKYENPDLLDFYIRQLEKDQSYKDKNGQVITAVLNALVDYESTIYQDEVRRSRFLLNIERIKRSSAYRNKDDLKRLVQYFDNRGLKLQYLTDLLNHLNKSNGSNSDYRVSLEKSYALLVSNLKHSDDELRKHFKVLQKTGALPISSAASARAILLNVAPLSLCELLLAEASAESPALYTLELAHINGVLRRYKAENYINEPKIVGLKTADLLKKSSDHLSLIYRNSSLSRRHDIASALVDENPQLLKDILLDLHAFNIAQKIQKIKDRSTIKFVLTEKKELTIQQAQLLIYLIDSDLFNESEKAVLRQSLGEMMISEHDSVLRLIHGRLNPNYPDIIVKVFKDLTRLHLSKNLRTATLMADLYMLALESLESKEERKRSERMLKSRDDYLYLNELMTIVGDSKKQQIIAFLIKGDPNVSIDVMAYKKSVASKEKNLVFTLNSIESVHQKYNESISNESIKRMTILYAHLLSHNSENIKLHCLRRLHSIGSEQSRKVLASYDSQKESRTIQRFSALIKEKEVN